MSEEEVPMHIVRMEIDRHYLWIHNDKTLTVFPREIWHHIIRYLECFGKDFQNLSLCCYRFKQLAQDSIQLFPIIEAILTSGFRSLKFLKQIIIKYNLQWDAFFLIQASMHGNYKAMKIFVNSGYPISQFVKTRAFTTACSGGYVKIAQMFISEIDPSRHDNEIIKTAVANGCAQIIQLLLLDDRVRTTITSEALYAINSNWELKECHGVIAKFYFPLDDVCSFKRCKRV